jgi:type IV secretory pathway protease TraF
MAAATLTVTAVGVIAIGFAEVARPAWRLAYNPSLSAPRGFYLLAPLARGVGASDVEGVSSVGSRGDAVLAWPPAAAAHLADHRHYVPLGVPLLKSVSAVFRDRVCRLGPAVTINGRFVAIARSADRADRLLPVWQGCRRLGRDELFLLGASPASFDSRYFGPVDQSMLIARATPLWTW